MRQSSTTASHTSDTTAVTAYSTAIKANTFHMVCSCLRNSESVLGPHGGGPLCLLQQAFQPIHQHVYIVWFGRDKHGVSFHMQVKSGLGQWDKALAFSLGNAPTTVGWPNHGKFHSLGSKSVCCGRQCPPTPPCRHQKTPHPLLQRPLGL